MAEPRLTKIGKEFRKIRIDEEINRGEMAKALGMTSHRLQSIETGRDEIEPAELKLVCEIYADENPHLTQQLSNAAARSIRSVTFQFDNLSRDQIVRVLELRAAIDDEMQAEVSESIDESMSNHVDEVADDDDLQDEANMMDEDVEMTLDDLEAEVNGALDEAQSETEEVEAA